MHVRRMDQKMNFSDMYPLEFRVHAIGRMFQRKIGEEEVKEIIKSGKTIEEYPDDKPYASRLILGWIGARPIHVVAANNHKDEKTIIITVYEPTTQKWEESFERRKIKQ